MSCWSLSLAVRGGGKGRNAHVRFYPQYGILKMAWAAHSRLLAISDQLGPGAIAK